MPDGPEAPDFRAVFPDVAVPTLTGTEPCASWPDMSCTIGAGHYYSSRFHVAFDLHGEWTNTLNWANVIELRDGPRVIAFLSGASNDCYMGWWNDLWYCDPFTDPAPLTAAELRATLDSFPELTLGPVDTGFAIDGRPTSSFVLQSRAGSNVGDFGGTVVSTPSGSYGISGGRSVRLSMLEIDGESVIVALEAPSKSLPRFLADMQPMLDSIRFEDFR